MQKIANKKTWGGYIGRFLLIHVITYSIIGILFYLYKIGYQLQIKWLWNFTSLIGL